MKRAIRNEDAECIRVLLSYGADLEISTSLYSDDSPMQFAIKHCPSNHLIFKLLEFWLELHQDEHPSKFREACNSLIRTADEHHKTAISDALAPRTPPDVYDRIVNASLRA